MQSHRASFWSSLTAVTLAVACFCAAYSFQQQHGHAQRVIRHAMRDAHRDATAVSLPVLPNPQKYLLRAWWMFYFALGVCAFAVVMANAQTPSAK
jgi:hypothetical protein